MLIMQNGHDYPCVTKTIYQILWGSFVSGCTHAITVWLQLPYLIISYWHIAVRNDCVPLKHRQINKLEEDNPLMVTITCIRLVFYSWEINPWWATIYSWPDFCDLWAFWAFLCSVYITSDRLFIRCGVYSDLENDLVLDSGLFSPYYISFS